MVGIVAWPQEIHCCIWENIETRFPNVKASEEGCLLKDLSFQSWRLNCQLTVSRLCATPLATASLQVHIVPDTIKQIAIQALLEEMGYLITNKFNSKLFMLLQLLKLKKTPYLVPLPQKLSRRNTCGSLPNLLRNQLSRVRTPS